MGATSRELISDIRPGQVFEFDYLGELHEFESDLAFLVTPNYDPRDWAARIALAHMLKPDGFNGNLHYMQLEAFDYPKDRLRDARKRGRTFPPESGSFIDGVQAHFDVMEPDQDVLGFEFLARASSSRCPDLGEISADIWYLPVRPNSVLNGADELDDVAEVRRIVTNLDYDKKLFDNVLEASKNMGAAAANSGAGTKATPGYVAKSAFQSIASEKSE